MRVRPSSALLCRSQKKVLFAVAPLMMAASCARGATPAQVLAPGPQLVEQAPQGAASPSAQASPPAAFVAADGEVTIAAVAERALPSVVSVSMTRLARARRRSPFDWFFGPRGPAERRETGMGSGVIVAASGIVLTNNHVVEDSEEITVTTSDNKEYEAKILGTDKKSDLAVLQLEGNPQGLRPLPFGDSSKIRLGDVVLAIGNPFGVGQTVTMGIVSAKGRANVGIVDYEDFIQTDAAINPGNSGGALVNLRGELVGINTAILSRSGGYQGIGFAIPSNMAAPIMESLKQHGHVVRGWLGVSIQAIDQEMAKALELEKAEGVLISDVKKGGPADKGGVKRGDVVLSIDKKMVDSTGRLRNIIASAGAGAKVALELVRGGKTLTVHVELGEMPGDQAAHAGSPRGKAPELDGMAFGDLNQATREKFDIATDVQSGAVVEGVEPGSPASKAGLRPGDVILEVDRTQVRNAATLRRLYKRAKGSVLLLVHRDGGTVFIVIRR